jgi:hemerythrin superfamily protein
MTQDMQDRGNGAALAALVGGFALGMLASRMAPLIASASGSIRARSGEDPLQRLLDDHQNILSTLHEMEQNGSGSLPRRGVLFLRLKRTLGKHALAEEDVVYPLLHDEVHDTDATKHLYREHADMKIHLYELENLLKANADWTDRVRSLRQLIEGHIREEEEVEFPKLRALMDDGRKRSVSGLVRREEALIL